MKGLPLFLLALVPLAGVSAQAAPSPQVFFGIRPGDARTPGATVSEVSPGGTAAELGLRAGDVIVWMNGEVIASTEEMIERIRQLAVGDAVNLRVRRGTETVELNGIAQSGTLVARPRRVTR